MKSRHGCQFLRCEYSNLHKPSCINMLRASILFNATCTLVVVIELIRIKTAKYETFKQLVDTTQLCLEMSLCVNLIVSASLKMQLTYWDRFSQIINVD